MATRTTKKKQTEDTSMPEVTDVATIDRPRIQEVTPELALAQLGEDVSRRLEHAARSITLVTDQSAIEEANGLTVTTQEDFESAALVRMKLRNTENKVLAIIDPVIKKIRTGLDKLYDLKNTALEPVWAADKRLKADLQKFEQEKIRRRMEEEQKAREEQFRAQQEARRKEEEAARARAEAEAQARAAKNVREREAAALAAQAARVAEQQAQAARREEELAKSARLAVAAQETTTKAAGARTTVKKRPVVDDIDELRAGIQEGTVPSALLIVDEKLLNALWEEDRAMVAGWPGVKIIDEVVVGRR